MFLYHKVSKWIDSALKQDIPDAVTAFCFNLYDDGTGKWSMELIGASRFDLEDPDWPCDEVTNFMTRETPFRWRDSAKWDSVLQNMMGVLQNYLQTGQYADLLKSKSGVGIGFVDGDIEILFNSGRSEPVWMHESTNRLERH